MIKISYTSVEQNNLDKVYQDYNEFKKKGKTEKAIATLEKVVAIETDAEKRALEYYKSNLDELQIDIFEEVQALLQILSNGDPEYEFEKDWPDYCLFYFKTFWPLLDLSMLKKNIDVLFERRKDFLGTPQIEELARQYKEIHKQKDANFSFIRQGTATNKLTKIKPKKNEFKLDEFSDTATYIQGDFSISLKNFTEIAGLKTSTHQLLDALTLVMTENNMNSSIVKLKLDDYMKMRGLSDKKAARAQVDADLETLYNASISFKQKKRKKEESYLDIRLISAKGIDNGIISVEISLSFFAILKEYNVMPFPLEILKLNNRRNPNSYYFYRKLVEHKNMHAQQKSENRLSVRVLLESSPEIPSYEEVSKTNREYNGRIIEPFKRDMNACENSFTWRYCHANGVPLTQSEKKRMNYELFITLLVEINWIIDFPDSTEWVQRKEAKIIEAKAKKNKKQKKE